MPGVDKMRRCALAVPAPPGTQGDAGQRLWYARRRPSQRTALTKCKHRHLTHSLPRQLCPMPRPHRALLPDEDREGSSTRARKQPSWRLSTIPLDLSVRLLQVQCQGQRHLRHCRTRSKQPEAQMPRQPRRYPLCRAPSTRSTWTMTTKTCRSHEERESHRPFSRPLQPPRPAKHSQA